MTFVYIVLFENTLMHYKITFMMHDSVLPSGKHSHALLNNFYDAWECFAVKTQTQTQTQTQIMRPLNYLVIYKNKHSCFVNQIIESIYVYNCKHVVVMWICTKLWWQFIIITLYGYMYKRSGVYLRVKWHTGIYMWQLLIFVWSWE